jgi:alpha-beta hydrolase superfamily lysophospholipase
MGSFITRSYITKYGDELDGYICSGTGGPNPLGKAAVVLAEAEIWRLGEFGRSTFLSNLAFGGYNKRYAEHRTKYDWLTRDTEIVDRYDQDKFCNYVFTAAGFRDLFLLLNEISTKSWAKKVPKKLPIHMISGKEDPVGDYGKGVQKVFDLFQEAGVENLTLKLYDDCRHEVLNELNRREVYAELLKWMNAKIKAVPENSVALSD